MCFHLLVHLIDFRVADSTMTDENGEVEPDDEPPAKRAKYPMEDLGIMLAALMDIIDYMKIFHAQMMPRSFRLFQQILQFLLKALESYLRYV